MEVLLRINIKAYLVSGKNIANVHPYPFQDFRVKNIIIETVAILDQR